MLLTIGLGIAVKRRWVNRGSLLELIKQEIFNRDYDFLSEPPDRCFNLLQSLKYDSALDQDLSFVKDLSSSNRNIDDEESSSHKLSERRLIRVHQQRLSIHHKGRCVYFAVDVTILHSRAVVFKDDDKIVVAVLGRVACYLRTVDCYPDYFSSFRDF